MKLRVVRFNANFLIARLLRVVVAMLVIVAAGLLTGCSTNDDARKGRPGKVERGEALQAKIAGLECGGRTNGRPTAYVRPPELLVATPLHSLVGGNWDTVHLYPASLGQSSIEKIIGTSLDMKGFNKKEDLFGDDHLRGEIWIFMHGKDVQKAFLTDLNWTLTGNIYGKHSKYVRLIATGEDKPRCGKWTFIDRNPDHVDQFHKSKVRKDTKLRNKILKLNQITDPGFAQACANWREEDAFMLPDEITQFLPGEEGRVRLRDLTDWDWDEVFIFDLSVSEEDIKETIQVSDNLEGLVAPDGKDANIWIFVKDDKVVKALLIDLPIFDDTDDSNAAMTYGPNGDGITGTPDEGPDAYSGYSREAILGPSLNAPCSTYNILYG